MAAKPLVVIVGPTGSGKTSLAVQLAKQIGGEIICADSRTVYKGMDIGTAKPTQAEQKGVPHHLLDMVFPDEPFTVADFKREADNAILQIREKGKTPILVGGSGLYIDSVIYNYDFSEKPNERLRAELQGLSVLQLQQKIKHLGIDLPNNPQNPRHLMRTIENAGKKKPQNKSLMPNALVFGLSVETTELRKRCTTRVASMLEHGLIDEVTELSKTYGWDLQPMQAPAYRAFRGFVEGVQSKSEACERCVAYDMQLAKKQRTWFRRNKSIQWLDNPKKYVDTITTYLNKTI